MWQGIPTWWWWNWFCQRPPGSSPGSGSRRCRASWRGCRGGGPRWWPSPGCSWSSCKALGRGTWCPMPPHTSCWTDPGPALAMCWPDRSWTAWTLSTLETGDGRHFDFFFFNLLKFQFQHAVFLEGENIKTKHPFMLELGLSRYQINNAISQFNL